MIGNYKIIALCTARVQDDESNQFIETLNKQAVKKGYRLFVYGVCSDLYWNTDSEKGEEAIFKLINYDVIDILVIYEERIHNERVVKELYDNGKRKKIPTIMIGKGLEDSCHIRFHYSSGFEKVVRHVVEEHGITDIHYIAGGKDNALSNERQAVVAKVLNEKGVPFNGETMVSYGEFWSLPAQKAVEKLITENRLPKAIICANDFMAIAVCDTLKKYGYRVPQDVIVTGYDGVDEIMFSKPSVTSYKCDYEMLAATASEVITKILRGEPIQKSYEVEGKLILSESCGCNNNTFEGTAQYIIDKNNRFYGLQEMNRYLAESAAKLQVCDSVQEMVSYLRNQYVFDVCCMINESCSDETKNPFENEENLYYEDTQLVLFDTENEDNEIKELPLTEIVPDRERLLARGVPFIFLGLYSLSIPLGYVCFHYEENNISKYDKIPLMINFLNNAIGGYRNIQYQQYLSKQIENMYKTDGLTGLYNRKAFLSVFQSLQKECIEKNSPLTVVLADLDGLKLINDTYGHGAGDHAIYVVAQTMKNVCPKDAVCVRIGGDEMMAVFIGAYNSEKLQKAFDTNLEEYNVVSGKPYTISASYGICTADIQKEMEFESLLKKVDEVMYRNKEKKKSGR